MFNLKTTLSFIVLLVITGLTSILNAQEKITFIATDKLIVTADLYMLNDTLPYMILCHEQNSSRGEYKETAKKFGKVGFNCIAVDLRNGGTRNGVDNETSTLAALKHLPAELLDAKLDIEAAISYARSRSAKKVVLVGSGYSASLALDIGATDPRVASVMAFSPEDYFGGKLKTKDTFPKFGDKPVYIASSRPEIQDVKKFIVDIPTEKLVQFMPPTEGAHGSAALYTSDAEYHDYWISILMFARQIKP